MEHGADANVVALNVVINPEIRPIEDAFPDEPFILAVQPHLIPRISGYDVIYPEHRPIRYQDQVDPRTRHDLEVIRARDEQAARPLVNLEDYQRNLFELFNVREGRDGGTVHTAEVAEVIEESDDDDEYELPAQRVSLNR